MRHLLFLSILVNLIGCGTNGCCTSTPLIAHPERERVATSARSLAGGNEPADDDKAWRCDYGDERRIESVGLARAFEICLNRLKSRKDDAVAASVLILVREAMQQAANAWPKRPPSHSGQGFHCGENNLDLVLKEARREAGAARQNVQCREAHSNISRGLICYWVICDPADHPR